MPVRVPPHLASGIIEHLYQKLLCRPPEPENLHGLVAYFGAGKISARTQFLTMLKSEEFFDKRLRDKPLEEVAAVLYQVVLAREPESPEALQGAVDFLGQVGWQVQIDIMINSAEYIGRFGDDDLPNFPEPDAFDTR